MCGMHFLCNRCRTSTSMAAAGHSALQLRCWQQQVGRLQSGLNKSWLQSLLLAAAFSIKLALLRRWYRQGTHIPSAHDGRQHLELCLYLEASSSASLMASSSDWMTKIGDGEGCREDGTEAAVRPATGISGLRPSPNVYSGC